MAKEISDNELINDSLSQNPLPAWLWFALIAALAALLWGGGSWLFVKKQELVKDSPFLQVTNRDFSLFLWQNPEYMRANVTSKTGYLPGFEYMERITIVPGKAEEFISAPPDVLFLYHVWNRLLSKEFSFRKITVGEFKDFLEYCKEWSPKNWLNAPEDYKDLVQNLPNERETRIVKGVPEEVQKAFIGWKNYFKEGDRINLTRPTYNGMRQFLNKFPHYARNYWQNIVKNGRPLYLESLNQENKTAAEIPENELTGFLKAAYFNFEQSQKGL
ncbi:Uncharacterized protein PHSC3_001707 [Chlamydiales bacterium STE3]|nr:Uncharacterized protein PHSC3_001707 [Chlamydiales bacterium STE3]